MSKNTVKVILVHLMANLLNHTLISCNDPTIHDISFFVLEYLFLELRIIHEILSNSLLPSSDVLDTEAVRIEPW